MRTLSPAEPLIFDNNTIIPIEETTILEKSLVNCSFLYASKRPNAILVISSGIAKAYDLDLNEVPVEELIKETEGLKDLIENNR